MFLISFKVFSFAWSYCVPDRRRDGHSFLPNRHDFNISIVILVLPTSYVRSYIYYTSSSVCFNGIFMENAFSFHFVLPIYQEPGLSYLTFFSVTLFFSIKQGANNFLLKREWLKTCTFQKSKFLSKYS